LPALNTNIVISNQIAYEAVTPDVLPLIEGKLDCSQSEASVAYYSLLFEYHLSLFPLQHACNHPYLLVCLLQAAHGHVSLAFFTC
jgi:hypothetical protein